MGFVAQLIHKTHVKTPTGSGLGLYFNLCMATISTSSLLFYFRYLNIVFKDA